MVDLDWRSLVKPTGVDRGVDIGPLTLAAASADLVLPAVPSPPPRLTGTATIPITAPSSGLGKRVRVESGVVTGQRKKTRAPLSLRAMRESVGMSRPSPSIAPQAEEISARSMLPLASSSPSVGSASVAPTVFSGPSLLPSRIPPSSSGALAGSGGVPSLLLFPRPVVLVPGSAAAPPASSSPTPARPSLSPAAVPVQVRSSPPRPAVRPPIEHACTCVGERSYWSMGCRPEAGGFLSAVDKDMLSSAGVEGSANAGRIFLHRGLAILDFCEGRYKEAEAKASESAGEADKWKQYARTVYRVERPRFLDSTLAFATAAKANHELSSKFDDAFAKLMEMRLTGVQIFERYRSTLKDRDALAGAIEGLVREKEAVASRASEAATRVIGLEDRVQELERRNWDLERNMEGLSSRLEKQREIEAGLRSRVSDLESHSQDLDEELVSLKKDAIGQHERGFQKAVRQAKLFAPDLDEERFDPFKDVKDGSLVDEEEVLPAEEEDEESH